MIIKYVNRRHRGRNRHHYVACHITSHSRNPLLNLLIKLDAMGDAIIDLEGQFEWVIQKKISPQIFDNGLELNTVYEENG